MITKHDLLVAFFQRVFDTWRFAWWIVVPLLGLMLAALIVFVLPRLRKTEFGAMVGNFISMVIGMGIAWWLARYKSRLPKRF